jgi:ornithine cyclodeaminase/alanine dehydrogenase-like protein (mu-crystallin family)
MTTDIIGIIGQGFVGTAIREGMKNHFQIETYDKFKEDVSTCSSLREVCEKAHIVFTCLPTPIVTGKQCR